ncbi:hypothetical protein QOT17_014034 [Balamuthia mandrillaris]
MKQKKRREQGAKKTTAKQKRVAEAVIPAATKQVDTGKTAGDQDEGFLLNFLSSVLEPGVGPATLRLLNWVFVALFICFFLLYLSGGLSIHLLVLVFLGLGLFASMQWFLAELGASRKTEKRR